jgi:mannose/cellobiose epimerase-like protein (N-acyl-D-glucosamine 2-epimerase family)
MPEMTFGYVDSCAKFWTQAYDESDGGFYININRQGALSGSSIKNTLNQSRDAYGFVRAFQMTGDTAYLRYARYALAFMYAHAWDNANGGWFNSISKNGTPSFPGENKSAYHQHYALLGIAAAYEAMRDTTDWRWLMKGYEYNESKLWDSSQANFGYYDYVAANGSNPTDKSFNATVDAVTTHVLHLYLLTGEQQYKTRLLRLAENMIDRLTASMPSQTIGFAEKYTSDWQIKESETMTIMGHVLKTGWCLARIYQLEKDPVFLETAEQLVQSVLDKGYDHQNGGPYKDYNRITGQMLMWGITDTAKAWWQMEQAVTAGLMLYHVTGKEHYLIMADETLDFFMKYFVDHVYGEVFENSNKYGGFISQWGTTKGGTGKAGYHSIELGYYVYLYGKLLVKKEPAILHYSFESTSESRNFRMRPIGLPEDRLKIVSVTRNGEPYSLFDSTGLMLTVPEKVDGIFAVTYAPIQSATAVALQGAVPVEFMLRQNYPNPFNPNTTITFTVPQRRHVSLIVYDVLGKEVAMLVNEYREAGEHAVRFTAHNLSSGIYFYRMESDGYVQTKKLILMK